MYPWTLVQSKLGRISSSTQNNSELDVEFSSTVEFISTVEFDQIWMNLNEFGQYFVKFDLKWFFLMSKTNFSNKNSYSLVITWLLPLITDGIWPRVVLKWSNLIKFMVNFNQILIKSQNSNDSEWIHPSLVQRTIVNSFFVKMSKVTVK